MDSLAALVLLQSVAIVETVHCNYEDFTKHEVKNAVLACKAQAMVESSSVRPFTVGGLYHNKVIFSNVLEMFFQCLYPLNLLTRWCDKNLKN